MDQDLPNRTRSGTWLDGVAMVLVALGLLADADAASFAVQGLFQIPALVVLSGVAVRVVWLTLLVTVLLCGGIAARILVKSPVRRLGEGGAGPVLQPPVLAGYLAFLTLHVVPASLLGPRPGITVETGDGSP